MDDFTAVLESNLIILSPNEKSLAFANLLEEIFDQCEAYFQAAEFDDRVALSLKLNLLFTKFYDILKVRQGQKTEKYRLLVQKCLLY